VPQHPRNLTGIAFRQTIEPVLQASETRPEELCERTDGQ
jgi:hypothetical protein